MSNETYLLQLKKEFYPINKEYYMAAIQDIISTPIVLLLNGYFLYFTLTESVFTTRKVLKRTVLTFNFLNILIVLQSLILTSYYLNAYFNTGMINPNTCFYIRKIQLILMILLITTPLIFTFHRYFTIFSSSNIQNYIVIIIFVLINFPAIIMFVTMFFNKKIIWVSDEICVYMKLPTTQFYLDVLTSVYYVSLTVPIVVLIINCILLKRLNSLMVTSSLAVMRKNENKIVFINLLIQTIQPFIGQWPAILFYFYLSHTGNNIYLVWRILDALTMLSFVLNILFSIAFVEDVRNAFLKRIGISVSKDNGDIAIISNGILLKKKTYF
uniref:G_PROTEIN_RECEP_F1_2 domain-containing protein n=1 Tax=Parastrongyloides trichosuri TaxID=131310 RepID=A0A0N4Z411_PARTI